MQHPKFAPQHARNSVRSATTSLTTSRRGVLVAEGTDLIFDRMEPKKWWWSKSLALRKVASSVVSSTPHNERSHSVSVQTGGPDWSGPYWPVWPMNIG